MKTKSIDMKNRIPTAAGRLVAALLLALALVPWLVEAQTATPNPPGQISYQGFLTDANGAPLATNTPLNYTVFFRIYNTSTGGSTSNAIWGELQTVTVDKGYFSVLLGQGTSTGTGEPWTNNLTGVFSGPSASDRYIGITVNGLSTPNAEIQPRLRLLSSPYSFLAANANSLVGSSGQQVITSVGSPPIPTFNSGLSLASGSMRLNDNPLYFRGGNDTNSGMAYGTNNFPGTVDGPVLWGNWGGQLATTLGGPNYALQWDHFGNVGARLGVYAAFYNGNGSNLTFLNANNLSYGSIPDSRLSANVPLLNNNPSFNNGLQLAAGTLNMRNNFIYLRGTAGAPDVNDGLVYDPAIDGVNLFGFAGGELGSTAGGYRRAVHWNGSGQVAINGDPTGNALTVWGNVYTPNSIYVDGWFYCKFNGSYLLLNGPGTASWSSDERLKKDIETIPDAVATVKKLRGVTYHWNEVGVKHLTRDIETKWKSGSGKKEDDEKLWAEKRKEQTEELSKTQIGFIAQEVEKVFPDWVTVDNKGYRQINMQKLDAVLVNAIHEQQDQIEAQQKQLEELKSAKDSLEKRLVALEKTVNRSLTAKIESEK